MKPRKICKAHGCLRPAFSHEYCDRRDHQLLRSDSSFIRAEERREAKKKEPKKVIPRQSAAQKQRDAEYSSKVHRLKEEHSICEVPDCGMPTDDLHHLIGRGIHTNNEAYFMYLCRYHHNLCKESPLEAERLGIILTRTISRKHEY